MSSYWSATTGTVLILNPEEVNEFYRRYLLETYKSDEVTEEDVEAFVDMLSDYDLAEFGFLRSVNWNENVFRFNTLEEYVQYWLDAYNKKHRGNKVNRFFNATLYNEDDIYSGGILFPIEHEHKNMDDDDFYRIEDGSLIFFSDKSTLPQQLLTGKSYGSMKELINEFKNKLQRYLPENFNWNAHIGFFQCADFA